MTDRSNSKGRFHFLYNFHGHGKFEVRVLTSACLQNVVRGGLGEEVFEVGVSKGDQEQSPVNDEPEVSLWRVDVLQSCLKVQDISEWFYPKLPFLIPHNEAFGAF